MIIKVTLNIASEKASVLFWPILLKKSDFQLA
jgi:hypothetical protein